MMTSSKIRFYAAALLGLWAGVANGATGDITTISIETETNGMTYAQMKFLGLSTGGTFAFGMGTNNDPSAAKVVFTVTRPGYTSAGAVTSYSTTVYGTRQMRKAYPNDSQDDVTTSGSDVIAKFALSDFIYSGDTVTVAIASGLYTQGGTPTNAVAAATSVTNNSTNTYAKPVGRFVSVPYQRVTGNFTVEYFGGHRSAKDGKPLACVVFTASDSHSHTSTTTVSTMTLSAANASGIQLPVYAATIDVSAFADGDTITVNAKAYPWLGNATLDTDTGADGAAQPDERIGPQYYLLDAGLNVAPLYCVVDSATGSSSGVASTNLITAAATRCDTIATAKTKLAAVRANGENCCIYLVDNGGAGYAFNGSTVAFDQSSPARVWTTIAPHPTLGTLAGAIIASGNNTQANGKIRFSGLTLSNSSTGALRGTLSTGCLWLDGCVVNLSGAACIYTWATIYCTDDSITALTTGMTKYGTNKGPYKLVRGCSFPASGMSVDLYGVFANTGNFRTFFMTLDASGQTISQNAVAAYNKLTAYNISGNPWINTDRNAAMSGLLVACNSVARSSTDSAALFSIKADSDESNGDNVLLWHNSLWGPNAASSRLNNGYNSKGTVGYTRSNWSSVGNNWSDWNNKTDTFTGDGGASGNRTGAWPVSYQLGSFANLMEGSAGGFVPLFSGLYSNFNATHAYTSAASGDLTPTSGSPARNLIPSGKAVLPYDLAGNQFGNNGHGTAGAYQYAPDLNSPPSAGILAPATKTIYTYGSSITFAGAATDAEDVATPAMAWSSDRDGALGSGATITVSSLSYGRHTITLTATDSNNQTGTATIDIFITFPYSAPSYGAANYYVATTGNDSNDGSSWTLAKRTVQNAITTAGTAGGTKLIAVSPGWYETEASGRDTFSTTESGDTITAFEYAGVDGSSTPCPGLGTVGAVIASTATKPLNWDANCTSGTFVVDGIDYSSTTTSYSIVEFADAAQTSTMTIKNAVLSCAPTSGWPPVYGVGVQSPSRNIRLQGCRLVNGTGGFFDCRSANRMELVNCTGAFSNTTGPGSAFINICELANSDLGTLLIDGCTFTVSGNTTTPKKLLLVWNTITSGKIFIRNSTLSSTYNLLEVQPASASAVSLIIDRSTFTTNDHGQTGTVTDVFVGSDADTSALALGPVRITNSTFDCKGDGSGASVMMELGPECASAEVAYCTFRGHDYWNTPATNDGRGLGVYLRGAQNVSFHHNAIRSRGGLVNVKAHGMHATQNTMVSYTGTGTNGAPVFIRDENGSGATDTTNVVFTHNIVYAGPNVQYVFSIAPHDSSLDPSTWVIDSNLYYKSGSTSSSSIFYLNTGAGSFSGLGTFWTGIGGLSTYNDSYSVYSDPLLSPTMTLAPSSPAKGSQVLPPTFSWNDLGAYQRQNTPSAVYVLPRR